MVAIFIGIATKQTFVQHAVCVHILIMYINGAK